MINCATDVAFSQIDSSILNNNKKVLLLKILLPSFVVDFFIFQHDSKYVNLNFSLKLNYMIGFMKGLRSEVEEIY